MHAFSTLLGVEMKLSIRDMNMPIFALAMPLVVIAVIGAIFAGQPAYEGAPYSMLDQSVSAISTIAICAGGAMGLPIMIASSRKRMVFKRFFATPVGVSTILGVQVAVYAIYSIVSAVLVFGVAMLFFGYQFNGSLPGFLGAYLLTMAAMFGVGLLVGGVAPNERTANLLASLLYFPMLLLSGATLPYELMPRFVQIVADLLPLTQGIKLLKAASLGIPVDQVVFPIAIMLAWTLISTFFAWKYFRWE